MKCSDKSPRKLSYFWKKKTQEVIYSHLVLLYFPPILGRPNKCSTLRAGGNIKEHLKLCMCLNIPFSKNVANFEDN